MKTLSTLLACGILFFSCKKTTPLMVEEPDTNTPLANGLPDNYKSIDGYYHTCCYKSTSYTGNIYYTIYLFASFGDPSRNLPGAYNHYNNSPNNFLPKIQGNVSVGDIQFNDYPVMAAATPSPNAFYQRNFGVSQPANKVTWITDGNKSFKPSEVVISRAYPQIKSYPSLKPISKSNPYTIQFDTLASNYDSLTVTVTDGYSSSNNIVRSFDSKVSSVTFQPKDLAQLSITYQPYIYIYCYNYSHQTIHNKTYLFESAYKTTYSVTITN